ncbi:hypothetical protein LOAG_01792 [Loa loa]|uniref:Uncharacterized protein n=1 Tax=Loa loa TaxID=7209 RepID=A0A1S0U8W9_LOALO|nr:hypothetical protein LOAG_01792 [Loa loa]EFO26686.1 hypothetical protein LOAG_01792 [Loa loa]
MIRTLHFKARVKARARAKANIPTQHPPCPIMPPPTRHPTFKNKRVAFPLHAFHSRYSKSVSQCTVGEMLCLYRTYTVLTTPRFMQYSQNRRKRRIACQRHVEISYVDVFVTKNGILTCISLHCNASYDLCVSYYACVRSAAVTELLIYQRNNTSENGNIMLKLLDMCTHAYTCAIKRYFYQNGNVEK